MFLSHSPCRLRRGVPATCIPLLAYQSSRAQSEASDEAKYYGGYGARGIGTRWGMPAAAVRALRKTLGVAPAAREGTPRLMTCFGEK